MKTGKLEMEVKVGLFVTLGVGLTMFAILVLGGTDNILARSRHFSTHFPSVEGLLEGAKVTIGGIQVGVVSSIDIDSKTRDIKVIFSVVEKYGEWVRQDSTTQIVTQGVLGDKFLIVNAGTPDRPELADGSELPNSPTKGLNEFISKGDQLLISLNSIAGSMDRLLKGFESGGRSETFFQGMSSSAKNLASASEKLNRELDQMKLKSSINHLNGILEKVNNGTGTLGAIINDPALYDDVKSLIGGANRNRIVRNLVRKTIKESDQAAESAAPSGGADDRSN